MTNLPKSLDLSSQFKIPVDQSGTFSCSAQAIVAEAEADTGLDFSVDVAYGDLIRKDGMDMQAGEEKDYAQTPIEWGGIESFAASGTLVTLNDSYTAPKVLDDKKRRATGKLKDSKVLRFDSLSKPPTSDFYRVALGARKKPLTLLLSTEARWTQEDWIGLEPSPVGHVVNIIGYGEDVSPFTLKKEPYFIVRDSKSGGGHFKISAQQVERFATGVIDVRVTPVK